MKKAGRIKLKKKKQEILNRTQGFVEDPYVAFFQFIYALFRKAEIKSGTTNKHYFDIGGRVVELRFAGDGLEQAITPAFNHLKIPPNEESDLEVLLWDNASTGTSLPKIVSRYFDILGEWWIHLGIRGEIKELSNSRILAAYHLGPNIFSLIDQERNLALYWVADANSLPYYELSSPLKTVLHWWANKSGFQFIHSGAVGTKDYGVLLVGKGGSGKSTTSIACLESGMFYAADDYCLIRTDPSPFVYSIYNTAKLRGDLDLKRFPQLAPLVSNSNREDDAKALFFLNEHFPGMISRGFPIKAILLPEITKHKESRLVRTSAGAALKALAPSTLLQLPGAGSNDIKNISALIRRVPAYSLELGSDISGIGAAIRKVLS